MTAHVNDACIGCGLCTGVCPGVFTMTEEGVAAAGTKFSPSRRPRSARPQRTAPSTPLR